VETLVDSTRYWVERDAMRPRLRATGASLPRVPVNGSVAIAFEAGFGPAWDNIPADLQQAVLMLAAHYYEYRNDTALTGGCMPFGVSSLGTGRETAASATPVSRVPYKIIVRGAPWGNPERPAPAQRFRDGSRVFNITAVTEHDPQGRYLICFAQEELVV